MARGDAGRSTLRAMVDDSTAYPKRKMSKVLNRYEYSYSPGSVAQVPAVPRDAARLLIYDKKRKKTSYDTFRNIARYLPEGAILVFNETKVIPARIFLKKETGGWVEALYVASNKGLVQVLADRKLTINSRLKLSSRLSFEVKRSDGRFYFLKPSFPLSRMHAVLEKFGAAPVPPYIRHSRRASMRLRKQYQALFAKRYGSIAAPTASLHITNRLMRGLRQKGFGIEFVTLHVGLGTFAPVTEEQLKKKALHEERYVIGAGTARRLNAAKRRGRPIIAVGTTVVRALESAAARNSISDATGSTRLFIRPGYRFKFIDGIITNF
ncbi:MAG: hypothetical protein RIQ56_12, partial [Candidatus Parcubacteria bacterium]